MNGDELFLDEKVDGQASSFFSKRKKCIDAHGQSHTAILYGMNREAAAVVQLAQVVHCRNSLVYCKVQDSDEAGKARLRCVDRSWSS
jgi:hypothetical protein